MFLHQPNMFSAKRSFVDANLYSKKTTSPRAAFDPKYRVPNCWFIPTTRDVLKYKKSLLTHRRRLPPRIPNLRPYTKSFAPHDCEFTFKSRPLTTETTLKNRQLKRLRYPPLRIPRHNPKWEKAFFVPIGIRTPEARREMAGRVVSALLDDITIDLMDLELNSPPNLASPASSTASSPKGTSGYPSPIARPRPASPARASPTSFAPALHSSPYPSPIARPSPSKIAAPVTSYISAAPALASPPISLYPTQYRSASGFFYQSEAAAMAHAAVKAHLSPASSPATSLMADLDFSGDFFDRLGGIISDMDNTQRTYPSELTLSPEQMQQGSLSLSLSQLSQEEEVGYSERWLSPEQFLQAQAQQGVVYSERWPSPEAFLQQQQRQVYAQPDQQYPRVYSYSQQYAQAELFSQQHQQQQPQQEVYDPLPSLVEMYMQRTTTQEYQQFFDDIECDDYSDSYSFTNSNSGSNSYTDPYDVPQFQFEDDEVEDGPFIYTGIDYRPCGIMFAGVDYAGCSGLSECFDSPPTSSVATSSTSSSPASPSDSVSLGSPAASLPGSVIPSPMETSLPLLNDSDDTECWVHVPLGSDYEDEEGEDEEELFMLVTGAGDGAGDEDGEGIAM